MGSLNDRLRQLEAQNPQDRSRLPLTNEERDRRVVAIVDLYDQRGWPADDWRSRRILEVVVRASDRAAREQPNVETLARAERWRQQFDRCKVSS